MKIAFYDFDGTMTKGDSLYSFVIFAHGRTKFVLGLISRFWIFLGYLCGIYSNSYAKQKLMEHFFGGMEQDDFLKICADFQGILESKVKQSALDSVNSHLEQGFEVVVVSATFEEYLKPFCDKLGIGCIATRLEIKDGKISGKFDGQNCYGEQKAQRILVQFDLSKYDEIHAFGDSNGDKQMLELATHKFYRVFE